MLPLVASEAFLGIDPIQDTLYLWLVHKGLSCSMSFMPILLNPRFPLDSCSLEYIVVSLLNSTVLSSTLQVSLLQTALEVL